MNPFPGKPLSEERSSVPIPASAADVPSVRTADKGADRGLFGLINGFQTDDYILIGIIAVLFFEGCDDYILLAALGYLFVMGIL